jgi:hypothetical protein
VWCNYGVVGYIQDYVRSYGVEGFQWAKVGNLAYWMKYHSTVHKSMTYKVIIDWLCDKSRGCYVEDSGGVSVAQYMNVSIMRTSWWPPGETMWGKLHSARKRLPPSIAQPVSLLERGSRDKPGLSWCRRDFVIWAERIRLTTGRLGAYSSEITKPIQSFSEKKKR